LLIALADRLAAVEKLAEEWSKPNHLGKYGYLAAQRLRSVLDGSGEATPASPTAADPDPAVSAVAHAIAPILGVDLNHESGSMAVHDVWQRAEMFVAGLKALKLL
jgi:hypothetical protein